MTARGTSSGLTGRCLSRALWSPEMGSRSGTQSRRVEEPGHSVRAVRALGLQIQFSMFPGHLLWLWELIHSRRQMFPEQGGEQQVVPIFGSGTRPRSQRQAFPITVAWPPPGTSYVHLLLCREKGRSSQGALKELVSLNWAQWPSLPPQPQPRCVSVSGQPCTNRGSVLWSLAVVWLGCSGEPEGCPMAVPFLGVGPSGPDGLPFHPHWVAVVSSSAEMTPYPQLHQTFHRWNESRCKMWFQTVPCILLRAGWARGVGAGADSALTWTWEREAKARRALPGWGGVGVRGCGTHSHRLGRGLKQVSSDLDRNHMRNHIPCSPPSPTTTSKREEMKSTS